MTQIPEGWTFRKDRFLYTLVDPDGNDVLSGGTEEACRQCLYCLPQFGGVAYTHTITAHVDL